METIYEEIELLNSEGTIFKLRKKRDIDPPLAFMLYDRKGVGCGVYTKREILEVLEGKSLLIDSTGKAWDYPSQSEDMKPQHGRLEKFIGI
jgi:hypothetical protein